MSYRNQSDLYSEDNISKYPAIELLCKLGFEYISPEDCMAQRGSLYDVLLKDISLFSKVPYAFSEFITEFKPRPNTQSAS